MKKFLFTLAALLMAVSSFAQTDAKYLYVNTALCEDAGVSAGQHWYMVVISAEFPAYLNAFEALITPPPGMTVVELEAGADYPIHCYNARGVPQTVIPAIAVQPDNPGHFVVASMQAAYDYVDGELVNVVAAKWGPGTYEEYIIAWCTIDDEVYHGGAIDITTTPSSGQDPRTTITDLGDKSVPHTTPATEPLPDPDPEIVYTDAPSITYTETEEGYLVTAVGDGEVILYVEDIEVDRGEGTATYLIPYTNTPEGEEYGVSATAQEQGKEVSQYTVITIEDPGQTAKPALTYEETEDGYLVTAVGNGEVIIYVEDEQVATGDGTVTYLIPYTNTPEGEEYGVSATAQEEGQRVSEYALLTVEDPGQTASPNIAVVNDPDARTVTVTATGDGHIVLMWDDQVVAEGEGTASYTINYLDDPDGGEEYGMSATAQEEGQRVSDPATVTVEVPNNPWIPVAEPVISYAVVGDQVVVTIEWPTTTGNQVYTGQYTYDRPAAGEETAMYDVEAYTEADYPYEESAHAYLTIFVPPLEPDQTPAPSITYTDNGEGILVTVTGEGNIVVYVEDEQVASGTSPVTYLLPYSEYAEGEMVTVSATAQAEGEIVSVYAIEEIFVPHKQPAYVAAPVIETSMDADYVYVTITWPTTDGDQMYNGEYRYERGDADYSVDVEAYTTATPNYLESVHANATIEVPAKEVVEMKVYVKVTDLDQMVAGKKYIFVCGNYAMGEIGSNGFGAQVEVTPVRAEGEVLAPENVEFTLGGETGAWTFEQNDLFLRQTNGTGLQMGEDGNVAKWNVNNNNGDLDGFRARGVQYDNRSVKMHNSMNRFGNYANGDTQSTFAFLYVEKEEAPVLDPVPDPVIDVETGKYNEAIVTITCDEEDATIYYRYQFDDGAWSDWAVYDGPITFVDNGHYNMEAYATADDMEDSNVVPKEFNVSDCTAVSEINGGKAIAGVRYFNMAGQEMAQPEGMTIIVTTYTDGTTSAVKVMK